MRHGTLLPPGAVDRKRREEVPHAPAQGFCEMGARVRTHHPALQRGMGERTPLRHPLLGDLVRAGHRALRVDWHAGAVSRVVQDCRPPPEGPFPEPQDRRPRLRKRARLEGFVPAVLPARERASRLLLLARVQDRRTCRWQDRPRREEAAGRERVRAHGVHTRRVELRAHLQGRRRMGVFPAGRVGALHPEGGGANGSIPGRSSQGASSRRGRRSRPP